MAGQWKAQMRTFRADEIGLAEDRTNAWLAEQDQDPDKFKFLGSHLGWHQRPVVGALVPSNGSWTMTVYYQLFVEFKAMAA